MHYIALSLKNFINISFEIQVEFTPLKLIRSFGKNSRSISRKNEYFIDRLSNFFMCNELSSELRNWRRVWATIKSLRGPKLCCNFNETLATIPTGKPPQYQLAFADTFDSPDPSASLWPGSIKQGDAHAN